MHMNIFDRIPLLANAGEKERTEFLEQASHNQVPAGTMLAWEGDPCHFFSIVLSGSVRVYKLGKNGREITLYNVSAGESCMLTAFGVLSNSGFPALAIADSDLEIALIPAPVFRDWVNRYEVWRNYVFERVSHRLVDILATLESALFQRLDTRIAEFLIRHAGAPQSALIMTHDRLAKELGTSREVVSRILAELKQEGIVTLERGKIVIADLTKLRKLSENFFLT